MRTYALVGNVVTVGILWEVVSPDRHVPGNRSYIKDVGPYSIIDPHVCTVRTVRILPFHIPYSVLVVGIVAYTPCILT